MLEWVKKNKLTSVLIFVVLYFLFGQRLLSTFLGTRTLNLKTTGSVSTDSYEMLPAAGGLNITGTRSTFSQPEVAPSESADRLVVTETSLSLVVKTVRDSVNQVIRKAEELGGFMVNSSLTQPEEAPYAKVVVRVPADKLQEALNYYRDLAVKVSSENITGRDVTDQYEDIEAKIATLEKVKAKFESTLEIATEVQDILQVQRELISVQTQIDNLKGRADYLEKTAKLAKITLHLSTDEWSLPYTPSKPFRPGVIFKQAVRSLVLTARGIAEKAIWIFVYGVIWGPVLLLVFWWKRRQNKTPKPAPPNLRQPEYRA